MKYLLALGLLVALPASAQMPTNPIEVTPFVGYLFGGTVFSFTEPPPLWIPGVHIADHLTYGLRIGFNATPKIEPEIQWSHTETKLSPPELDPLRINFFIAGANYNFSAGKARPYISVGLGAGLFDGINYSNHTLFTTSLALGAKYFFTPNFALRLEARGYASKPDSIIEVTCPSNCPNNWIFNGDLTGGLTAAF